VVEHVKNAMKIILKERERSGIIKMTKQNKTMMRVPKELLKELKAYKICKGESYAEVVKRIIEKERRLKK